MFVDKLKKNKINSAQLLLTLEDSEVRRRYLNVRKTISALHKQNIIPIINENDTVATEEIRFGDNDLLAAKISTLFQADLLVVLSSVDGLYTSEENIKNNKGDSLIKNVPRISAKIKKMAGKASEMGKGGMISKIQAAEICFKNKSDMVITSGKTKLKNIYDPTCGSGSLLLRVAKEVEVSEFYGQELNRTTFNLARMNMILHDVHYREFDIQQEDTLENPQHRNKRFEAIVANPPFSAHWKGAENPLNHEAIGLVFMSLNSSVFCSSSITTTSDVNSLP